MRSIHRLPKRGLGQQNGNILGTKSPEHHALRLYRTQEKARRANKMHFSGLSPEQQVAGSNPARRAKPLQVNELALQPSVPKLVDSNRESRRVETQVALIQRLNSGRERMLGSQRLTILLNSNRFVCNNLARRTIGCFKLT